MSYPIVPLSKLIQPAKTIRAGKSDLPVLSMTMRDGLVDQASKFKKRVASEDTSNYKVVRSGQLVVGFPIDEGVLSFQRLYPEAIVSPAYDVWDVSAENVSNEYLEKFLRCPLSLSFYSQKMRGSTARRRTLPDDIFLSLDVPVPPIAEQHRIATILDKADALRAHRREVLAQLDRLAQAIFVEIFGDPVTNPKGWRRLQLGEIFGIARGGSPRPIDDYITDSADGVNWVMIGDTEQGGKYIWSTKKKIRPEGVKRSRLVKSGDFLLTNSMSFGRPYILKTNGCIHDGWLVLSPQITDFNPDYFYTLLGSQAVFTEFSKRAAGATVKNLNIDLVSSVEVAVPPLAEQRRFAKAVEAIESVKSRSESSATQLDSLFGSLQACAFSGRL